MLLLSGTSRDQFHMACVSSRGYHFALNRDIQLSTVLCNSAGAGLACGPHLLRKEGLVYLLFWPYDLLMKEILSLKSNSPMHCNQPGLSFNYSWKKICH